MLYAKKILETKIYSLSTTNNDELQAEMTTEVHRIAISTEQMMKVIASTLKHGLGESFKVDSHLQTHQVSLPAEFVLAECHLILLLWRICPDFF